MDSVEEDQNFSEQLFDFLEAMEAGADKFPIYGVYYPELARSISLLGVELIVHFDGHQLARCGIHHVLGQIQKQIISQETGDYFKLILVQCLSTHF